MLLMEVCEVGPWLALARPFVDGGGRCEFGLAMVVSDPTLALCLWQALTSALFRWAREGLQVAASFHYFEGVGAVGEAEFFGAGEAA